MLALKISLGTFLVVCMWSGALVADKDNSKSIVGKWEVAKTDSETLPVGTTIEFTADGKVRVTTKAVNDNQIEGSYVVEGETLTYHTRLNGKAKSQTLSIKKLEEKEINAGDKDNKVVSMRRLH